MGEVRAANTTGTPPNGTPPAASQTTPPKTDTSTDTEKFYKGIIMLNNFLIDMMLILLAPLIILSSWLLTPDWTYGEVFNLRPVLYTIWVFISNIVYLIFGFALVVIAFMNIFGRSSYAIKTTLPKLILGVLTVPFTWFFVSFILSIVNVFTAVVMQFPSTVLPKINDGTIEICTTGYSTKGATSIIDGTKTCEGEIKKVPISQVLSGKGAYSVISVYAFGIFKMDNLKNLKCTVDGLEAKAECTGSAIMGGITKLSELAIRQALGLIFVLIFFILLIALVFALFSRAFTLWFFISLSPVFSLFPLMGKGMEKLGALKNITVGKFLGAAMVPVYVGAALSFGLMFLSLLNTASGDSTNTNKNEFKSDYISIKTEGEGDNKKETISLGDGDEKITFTSMGKHFWEGLGRIAGGGANIALGGIGGFILSILAVAVIWVAVMAALQSSEITKAAVEPISAMGGEIAKLAKQAPTLIPIPGSGGQSLASLRTATSTVTNAYTSDASQRGSLLGSKIASSRGLNTADLTTRNTALNDIRRDQAASLSSTDMSNLQRITATFANAQEFVGNPQAKEALRILATKANMSPQDFDAKFKPNDLYEIFKKIEEIGQGRNIHFGNAGTDIRDSVALNQFFRGGAQANAANAQAQPNAPQAAAPVNINIQVTPDGRVVFNSGNPANNLSQAIITAPLEFGKELKQKGVLRGKISPDDYQKIWRLANSKPDNYQITGNDLNIFNTWKAGVESLLDPQP